MAASQDPYTIPSAPSSASSEPVDLVSNPHSLHSTVYARRREYIRTHRVRIKIGTWNVAACPGADQDLRRWFVSDEGVDSHREDTNAARLISGDKIGLYVLGLQEVVELNLASQYVTRVYADSASPMLDKWKAAVGLALPQGYQLVASEQMSGLLLLIYASPELAPMVSHTSTSATGTGLLGLLGNKGAVSARLILGEATRMAFVNSHLASGMDTSHVERRCWDVAHISSRAQFDPYSPLGAPEANVPEKIADADFAFWFGDLNFRLDGLPGEDIRHLLTLHTRGEYGAPRTPESAGIDGASLAGEDAIVLHHPPSSSTSISSSGTISESPPRSSAARTDDDREDAMIDDDSEDVADRIKALPPLPDTHSDPDPNEYLPDPSDDPSSLQATLDSLLPHDQLRRMMRERRAFHDGWCEGHITFLPSYKYDVGTVSSFDSSEKRRAPSWCDRILYCTRKDREDYKQRVQDDAEAKKRDDEMKARGLDHANDDDDVLFEYQPDTDLAQQQQTGREPASIFEYDEYDEGEDNDAVDVSAKDAASHSSSTTVDRIQLDIYTSHQRIQSSDHKPVVAVFTLDFDAVVPELKAKVHTEVAKELDRAENEGRPGVTVVVDHRGAASRPRDSDEAVVNFGPIAFLRKAVAFLTIANTGRVPAVFSFVQKPSTEDLLTSSSSLVHPYQWLATSFVLPDRLQEDDAEQDLDKEVTLEPGNTVTAALKVLVDDLTFVQMLNDGASTLDDVLILRVMDGRDHFIPVRATWLPTCIGRSIEELVRVPDGGIRPFLPTHLQESDKKNRRGSHRTIRAGSIPYDSDVRCSAPKELFKLTEAIENLTDRVVADEQMLGECKIPSDQPGWPFEAPTQAPKTEHVVAIIEALDNDWPLLDAFEPEVPSLVRLETVSHVLLLFLRGLTDGIVTIPLWARINQAPLLSIGGNSSDRNGNLFARDSNYEADKLTVLDVLSSAPHHNISFVFLTTTLSRVLSELAPLSLADQDALRTISRSTGSSRARGSFGAAINGIGGIGWRSLSSFRKTSAGMMAGAALAAFERRQARERRYAEIFGKLMCRAPATVKEKDQKVLDDKRHAVVELFLRRAREEMC